MGQPSGTAAERTQWSYPTALRRASKKRRNLLLFTSDSDSDDDDMDGPNRALNCYRAAHSIGMEDCPLLWWSAQAGNHKQVSDLARKYLAVSASSVPYERLFSLAGHIVQKKRADLISENVES